MWRVPWKTQKRADYHVKRRKMLFSSAAENYFSWNELCMSNPSFHDIIFSVAVLIFQIYEIMLCLAKYFLIVMRALSI